MEQFDLSMVHAVSPAKLVARYGCSRAQSIMDTLAIVSCNDGMLPVEYFMVQKMGRYVCESMIVASTKGALLKPICLPFMPRDVRSLLCGNIYYDVDIQAAVHTLMSQAANRLGLTCSVLEEYVATREDVLLDTIELFGVDRVAAKNLYIRLVFGGSIKKWAEDAGTSTLPPEGHISVRLAGEMQKLIPAMAAHPWLADAVAQVSAKDARCGWGTDSRFTEMTGVKGSSAAARAVAHFVFDIERICITALKDAVESEEWVVGAVIYDGMLLDHGHGTMSMPTDADLQRWEDAVRRTTGYCIRLGIKDMGADGVDLCVDQSGSGLATEDVWPHTQLILSYNATKVKFEQRWFKLVDLGMYGYLHNNQLTVKSSKDIKESYHEMKYSAIIDGKDGQREVELKDFVPRWLKDASLRKYQTMELRPPPMDTIPTVFNMWTPFDAQLYVPPAGMLVDVASDGVGFLEDFIHGLFAERADVTGYIMDWLAQMLQQPGLKPGVALVLTGDQAVGKNRFSTLVMKLVGSGKWMQTNDPLRDLCGSFTKMREGKVLCVVDELQRSQMHQAEANFKDILTSDTFNCNEKYQCKYTARCLLRVILTSNEDNPVTEGPGSRRYFVVHVSSKFKGQDDFFAELSRWIDDPHTIHELFVKLMHRDISHISNWQSARPVTSEQVETLAANARIEERFLKHLVLTDAGEDSIRMFEGVAFYAEFRRYAEEVEQMREVHIPTMTKFGTCMGSLVEDSTRQKGIVGFSRPAANKRKYVLEIGPMTTWMVDNKWIEKCG